jgi:hypothetical protein
MLIILGMQSGGRSAVSLNDLYSRNINSGANSTSTTSVRLSGAAKYINQLN